MASVQEESDKCKTTTLAKRRKLHLAQLARWMARFNKYRHSIEANTRLHASNRVKLKVPSPRKQKVKRSFLYQASGKLNELPPYLHCTDKPDEFKKEVVPYPYPNDVM